MMTAKPASSHQGLLARHPLVSFFVMAYAFSWIVWSPWVLGQDGAGVLPIHINPALIGYLNAAAILADTTLAAFIMTATTRWSTRWTCRTLVPSEVLPTCLVISPPSLS
jgi:hypothetical protein